MEASLARKMETDKQENAVYQQVLRMKIAVAVACCAMKPENTSVRTFTEGLCGAFHKSNHQLQHKCVAMETELLKLRQELAMNMLGPPSLDAPAEGNDENTDNLILTPPLSGSEFQHSTALETSDLDRLQRNTRFLQCVINLQQAARRTPSSNSEICAPYPAKLNSYNCTQNSEIVQREQQNFELASPLKSLTDVTVHHSLQTMRLCLQDKTFVLSVKSLQHCTQCVVQILDKTPDLMQTEAAMSLIKDILKSLLENILRDQEDGNTSQMQKNREQYTRLVLLFSKSSAMKLTLEVLMGENESFSRHLRNVCSNGVPLQVSWFENMIFVIRILEMVLNQYLCSSVNKDIDLLQHVKDKLDDSLLHVTDRFPLYAHSIWKISGLIQLHLSKLT